MLQFKASCFILCIFWASVAQSRDTGYNATKDRLNSLAQRVDWKRISLNRKATRAADTSLKRNGVKKPHVGYMWNRSDQNTPNWYPQGVTGLPDKKLAISWYSKHGTSGFPKHPTPKWARTSKNRGARISIIDVSRRKNVRYRHILLVQSAGKNGGIKAVETHAGGLAMRGHYLYVTESASGQRGMRVFDMRDMWKINVKKDKRAIGVTGQKVYAHGYEYILLQKKLIPMSGMKFSYVSWDWTYRPDSSEPLLFTGNFNSSGKYHNPPAGISWWRQTNDGLDFQMLRNTKTEGKGWYPNKAQGAAARDGVVWFSTSGSNPTMYVTRLPATKKSYKKYSWITGAEDLHYSKSSGLIWSCSEWPKKRFIFAIKAWDYRPN